MRDTITCNQRQSAHLLGDEELHNHMQSEAIRGNQHTCSAMRSCNQRQSEAIRGNQHTCSAMRSCSTERVEPGALTCSLNSVKKMVVRSALL